MIRPLRSARVTEHHRYYETVRPCASHRYSAPHRSRGLGSSLHQPTETDQHGETTGSHVPHQSLDWAHATFMPDTTEAINGHPLDQSRASLCTRF